MNNGRKLQTNGLRERNGLTFGVATSEALQGAWGGTGKPPKKSHRAQRVAHQHYESASFLSHAETPSGLALALYPRFSCGVQRKPTRAVAGFLMGGLPLGRLGLSMGELCTHK